jgi:hypothetical protein
MRTTANKGLCPSPQLEGPACADRCNHIQTLLLCLQTQTPAKPPQQYDLSASKAWMGSFYGHRVRLRGDGLGEPSTVRPTSVHAFKACSQPRPPNSAKAHGEEHLMRQGYNTEQKRQLGFGNNERLWAPPVPARPTHRSAMHLLGVQGEGLLQSQHLLLVTLPRAWRQEGGGYQLLQGC